MSERVFRVLLGAAILLALYFNLLPLLWAIVGLLVFEGLTNWRVPCLLSRLSGGGAGDLPLLQALTGACARGEAERVLRLLVAAMLGVSLGVAPANAWAVPWFIGFALVGAGMSGICPMVLALRRLGFS